MADSGDDWSEEEDAPPPPPVAGRAIGGGGVRADVSSPLLAAREAFSGDDDDDDSLDGDDSEGEDGRATPPPPARHWGDDPTEDDALDDELPEFDYTGRSSGRPSTGGGGRGERSFDLDDELEDDYFGGGREGYDADDVDDLSPRHRRYDDDFDDDEDDVDDDDDDEDDDDDDSHLFHDDLSLPPPPPPPAGGAGAAPLFGELTSLQPLPIAGDGDGSSRARKLGGGAGDGTAPPRIAGYLQKQSRHGYSWRRRWFVLRDLSLEYASSPSDGKPQGIIPLRVISAVQTDSRVYPHPNCLQLITPSRIYVLRTSTAEELDAWLLALQGALAEARPDASVALGASSRRAAAEQRAAAAGGRRGTALAGGSSSSGGGGGAPTSMKRRDGIAADGSSTARAGSPAGLGGRRATKAAGGAEPPPLHRQRLPGFHGARPPTGDGSPRATSPSGGKAGRLVASPKRVVFYGLEEKVAEVTAWKKSPYYDDELCDLCQQSEDGAADDAPLATVECSDCDMLLCGACSDELHATRSRRMHRVSYKIKRLKSAVPPEEREKLIASHMRRPKVTARQLGTYLRWINGMQLGPKVTDLKDALRDGLLLCKIMAKLTGQRIKGLHGKPRRAGPAMANSEKALALIWQRKVFTRLMPTAAEIWEGKSDKILLMVRQVWTSFPLKDAKSRAKKTVAWAHGILRSYGVDCVLYDRPVTPPYDGLWEDFRSGVAFFCLLHYFFGHKLRRGKPIADPAKVEFEPNGMGMRSNLTYVQDILSFLRIPWLFTAEDFVTNNDADTLLVQLDYIWQALGKLACGLRKVGRTNSSGIVTTPSGERVVAGVVFGDGHDTSDWLARRFGSRFAKDGPATARPAAVALSDADVVQLEAERCQRVADRIRPTLPTDDRSILDAWLALRCGNDVPATSPLTSAVTSSPAASKSPTAPHASSPMSSSTAGAAGAAPAAASGAAASPRRSTAATSTVDAVVAGHTAPASTAAHKASSAPTVHGMDAELHAAAAAMARALPPHAAGYGRPAAASPTPSMATVSSPLPHAALSRSPTPSMAAAASAAPATTPSAAAAAAAAAVAAAAAATAPFAAATAPASAAAGRRASPLPEQLGTREQMARKKAWEAEKLFMGGSGGAIHGVRDLERMIRSEESRLMEIEERRRQAQLAEEKMRRHMLLRPAAAATAAAAGAAGDGAYDDAYDRELDDDDEDTGPSVEEALELLEVPQLFRLRERNSSRDFDFNVTEVDDEEGQPELVLKWTQAGEPAAIVGFVRLADVERVERSAKSDTSFIVYIESGNPAAIRSSGGLRALCIDTDDAEECEECAAALFVLVDAMKAAAGVDADVDAADDLLSASVVPSPVFAR